MAQTHMEKCLEGIINIYHRYSARVDHWDMISHGELKQLLQQELPTYLKASFLFHPSTPRTVTGEVTEQYGQPELPG
ncbi:UNVERIFIED_CONTAM: hypothetical protein K2H54_023119 [Gekko kuhli]